MDPALLDAISDVGLGALLIGTLIGGYRGWWVFGPVHERIVAELAADRDFWRDTALRGTRLAETAVDVATGDRLGDYRRADSRLGRDGPAR